MHKKAVFLVAAIGLALGLNACKPAAHPSCKKAMDNFYDRDCVITYDDGVSAYDLTEEEAVDGCRDDRDMAADEECMEEYNDALDCLADAEECDDCNSEFQDYNDCLYY